MRNYVKTGLTLMMFSVIVAFMLSAVYLVTKDPIAKAEVEQTLIAIRTVLTNFDNDSLLVAEKEIPATQPELDKKIWKDSDSGKLFESDKFKGFVSSPAYVFNTKNGEKIYILTGGSVGYGGNVIIIASFIEKEGKITLNAIKTLDFSQETPGLGAKIADKKSEERFYKIPQSGLKSGVKVDKDANVPLLKGKNERQEKKLSGIIYISDIMTGATITPRAVANTINIMYEYLSKTGGW